VWQSAEMSIQDQKEIILAAGQRAIDMNGGVPLGQKRFFDSTGFKLDDLYNAGLRNYGDLLEELGYQRKKLNRAFSDDELLRPLALLTRRLGHFPVNSERIIEHKRDATFPSKGTFDRRAKSERLDHALMVWCQQNDGFSDVVVILQPRVSVAPAPERTTRRRKIVNGYVYLKRYGAHGKYYKLGYSDDVDRRHAQIENMLPGDLQHVHSIATDDPKGIERYWQVRFKDKLVPGKIEIFCLTTDDVTAFRNRDYQ
jgi:hypothetical protein